jgi:2-desacetyl-2-hydroxyethyl bacteriochlorophyllide A dehydrogenase
MKMKVLCINKPGELEIKDLPYPVRKPNEAIVKMEMCGICGSDVTAYRGVNPTMKYPIEGLGHEGVGTIEEIDENNSEGLKVGDRVALEPYVGCGHCYMCKTGRYNNCTDIRVCGVHKNGMMAEYFVHPVNQMYKIPDDMTFLHAALTEPLTIGLHGTARAKVGLGDRVVVFGAGVIGLMACFAAMNRGAVPIVIDMVQARLDKAKKLGVPYAFNSTNGGVEEYLKEVTNGKLPEAMVDCTGAAPIINNIQNYVAYGGRVALVGWPHADVKVNQIRLMQKEIDVYPSRNSAQEFPPAIDMIERGKLPADGLITKTISLEEVDATIQDMIANPSDYLKVIVKI